MRERCKGTRGRRVEEIVGRICEDTNCEAGSIGKGTKRGRGVEITTR
jgi:hypothetical protein